MPNYYSNFVAKIPSYTEKQRKWLQSEIAEPKEIEEARNLGRICERYGIWGGDSDEEWNLEFHDDSTDDDEIGHLYLSGEYSPHEVAFLVCVYADKFNLFNDEPFILSVAHTVDKPQPDGFGGSSYCVYKGRAFYVDTYCAVEDWIKEEDQVQKIMATWEEAYA